MARLSALSKGLFFIFFLACSTAAYPQLVINEVSQGTSGTKEFAEFIVAGNKSCTDTCADLRGWIFDDNNGWHGSNGVAPGCLRFANIPQWQCVTYGSLILVYNPADKNSNITLPDDETDANNDDIYVLPITSNKFDRDASRPSGGNSSYSGTSFTNGGGSWTYLGMRNQGDVFHSVDPANLNAAHFSVGYGDVNTALDIYFNGQGSGLTYYMANTNDDNIFSQGNWVSGSAGTAAETPGSANTVKNGQWITNLRNNVLGGNTRDTNQVFICSGQTYFAGGASQGSSGFYTDTYQSAGGCDSIIVTDLRVVATTVQNQDVQGCGSVNVNGIDFFASTLYTDTLRTTAGCDSVYRNYSITVHTARTDSALLSGCQQVRIAGKDFFADTIYRDTLQGQTGCDSVYRIFNITIHTGRTDSTSLSGCQKVTVAGRDFFSNTIYKDTLQGQAGCDSVFRVFNITIGTISPTMQPACINSGQSYFAGGAMQTTPGLYYDTLAGSGVCDSVIITNLRVISIQVNNSNLQGCRSVLYQGNTYTSSITLRDTVQSVLGCDSLITVVGILIDPALGSSIRTNAVCINAGQSYFAGGASQTLAGLYTDTLITAEGCDSIILTDLQVISPVIETIELDSCGQVSYGGVVYTADATLRDTLFSVRGCDSLYLQVIIQVIPLPQVSIWPAGATISEDDSVKLGITPVNFPSVTWLPADGLSSTNMPQVWAKPAATTLYYVQVQDEQGCTAWDSTSVYVKLSDMNFIIPNAFTPNGDGGNEIFAPLWNGNGRLEEMRIYDRWGELVYEQRGGRGGWDGTYKGSPQPVGVYVYYVVMRDLNNNRVQKRQGSVTLIR